MAEQALSGVKVVECGSMVSAAYTAKLLADLGAEVVKIEQPGSGDEARSYGPFPGDIPHPERSGLFLYLNANKLGITLNLKTKTGRDIMHQLLNEADILVENYHPKEGKESGLDYATLKEVNKDLIMLSISPFGQKGGYSDYKGYEANCDALGGITMYAGEPNREPLNPPLFLGSYQAGVAGAVACLIAMHARDLIGHGQHIDLAKVDNWGSFHLGIPLVEYVFGRRIWQRYGRRAIGGPYPQTILGCKDGDFRLIAMTKLEWRRFLKIMDNPEWGDDPRFQDRIKMQQLYADELDSLIEPWLKKHTKQELFQMCYDGKVPFTPIKNIEDVVNDPHLSARDFFVQIDHPEAGRLEYPGPPYKFSKTPPTIKRPAPLLGEQNEKIYYERLGYSREDLLRLRRTGVI